MKTWLRRTAIAGLCILLALIIASHMMDFRDSTPQLEQWVSTENISLVVGETESDGTKLRWVASSSPSPEKPWLIFIHGAPGSLSDYKSLLSNPTLHRHANLMAIDRPGYGYSDFGKAVTSLKDQARHIMNAVNDVTQHSKQLLWIGHSYGGPIAAQLAADNPKQTKGMLLLAPAIDPDNEVIFKIAYLGKWYPTRWLTPTAWRVATDEKFTHVAELSSLKQRLKEITCPTILIHGTKDRIVPLANVEFAEAHLPPERLTVHIIQDGNHFLPWTHASTIVQAIHRMIGIDSQDKL